MKRLPSSLLSTTLALSAAACILTETLAWAAATSTTDQAAYTERKQAGEKQIEKPFTLNDQCPPSFERLADNTCQLRTLYDFYDSPAQHGGVQAELPTMKIKMTPQQIDLSRFLFFDPLLSANQDMSCASCHQTDKGLSDGLKRSMGAQQQTTIQQTTQTTGLQQTSTRLELNRSTPTLWNVGLLQQFMWDGRATSLQAQAELPLLAKEEMGNTREGVVQALNSSANYIALFETAYGQKPDMANITHALSAFQSTLISFNSRYDRYAHGDKSALSDQEVRGYNAFRGFVGRCSQCHVPPLFTDSELAVIGAPANDQGYIDSGAGALSDDAFKQGAFRVPTLRNISKTAPYFHSGQFKDLTEVVEFYNNTRGHAAPEDQPLKIHWHIHMTQGAQLSQQNVADIVAFLAALEDETHLPQIPNVLPSGLQPVASLTPASSQSQPDKLPAEQALSQ